MEPTPALFQSDSTQVDIIVSGMVADVTVRGVVTVHKREEAKEASDTKA